MLALLALATLHSAFGMVARQSSNPPTVRIQNGTVVGLHQPTYNEDLFLGIPYAEAPVGDLRLRLPQPVKRKWSSPWQATKYYPECVGYGGDQIGYDESEDCLAINVVRPSGCEGQKLPVAFWIHGGGYIMGGATDRRYNLSFIVENSVKIGKPIIAVSAAYRLSGWGFLDSKEVRDAGVTNIGMHDQRAALAWVQENIAAFGGDPSKVTIWGESAGAGSVGIHLIAYGGRDDKLFAGAIGESGNSILLGTPNYNVTDGQGIYNNITAATGCAKRADSLQCLREVSFESLNAALNVTPSYNFYPYVDGNLIRGSQWDQLNEGSFVKVPLLTGANTDEGTSFGRRGINNDTAFKQYLASTGGKLPLNQSTVDILAALYPNLPAVSDVLYDLPLDYQFPANAAYGTQFRRAVAFGGDGTFHAGRRLQCQSWSKYNISAYCYRFNGVPYPLPPTVGATHFQEVAFVFNNLQGLGYAANPFQGKPQPFIDLSSLMSRMWAAFVHDGNPNGHGLSGYDKWPVYDIVSGGGVGYDYFFDPNNSHVEHDSWRGEGIGYLNQLWKVAYGK